MENRRAAQPLLPHSCMRTEREQWGGSSTTVVMLEGSAAQSRSVALPGSLPRISPNLSVLEGLKGRLEGSSTALGLNERGYEHWLGKIRMAVAIEEALVLCEPIPLHCGNKRLFR